MLLVLGVLEAAAVREGGDPVRVDAFDGAAAAVFVEGVDGAGAREAARVVMVEGSAGGGVGCCTAEERLAFATLVVVLFCWVGVGA